MGISLLYEKGGSVLKFHTTLFLGCASSVFFKLLANGNSCMQAVCSYDFSFIHCLSSVPFGQHSIVFDQYPYVFYC